MPTIVNLKNITGCPDIAKSNNSSINRNCKKRYTCNHAHLKEALLSVMESYWDLIKGTNIIN